MRNFFKSLHSFTNSSVSSGIRPLRPFVRFRKNVKLRCRISLLTFAAPSEAMIALSEVLSIFLSIARHWINIEAWQCHQCVCLVNTNQMVRITQNVHLILTLTLGQGQVKATGWHFEVRKHMVRTGLSREARLCQNHRFSYVRQRTISKQKLPLRSDAILLFSSRSTSSFCPEALSQLEKPNGDGDVKKIRSVERRVSDYRVSLSPYDED